MTVTDEDIIFGTLMAYREAANQGDAGIIAVLSVAKNNALKKNHSFFQEVTTKFRFSSINCPISVAGYVAKNNINGIQQIVNALSSYPLDGSINQTVWNHIKTLVQGVLSGAVQDITNGATMYYSTAMDSTCPFDLSKLVFTTQIKDQRFYREL